MAQTKTKTKNNDRKKGVVGDPMTTPIFRAAFCWVHQTDSGREFSDDKYKITALVAKEREAELKPLKQGILKTAREAWGPKVKYAELETPFKDGDDKAERLESHTGQIYFQMKTNRKPGIVGPSLETLEDPVEDFYAGCWARAKVVPITYERTATVIQNGKQKQVQLKGVRLALQSLQKAKDDEKFGSGGSNPEEDFEELDLGEIEVGPDALDDVGEPDEPGDVGEMEDIDEDEIV